jgi:type IV pilus assembly protein PilY1
VDYNLNFSTDAIYFGTVEGSAGSWGGKLRRIVIEDELDPVNWDGDSVLIDLTNATLTAGGFTNGQPITAAPSIALDAAGNRWIYFGTGRFYTRTDAENTDQQSYYGIKEPMSAGTWTWGSVHRADLVNMSIATVYEDGTFVEGVPSGSFGAVVNWDTLLQAVDEKSGWFMDFADSKERNLGQATLLGDILTFTTYIPSLDPCEFEGYTNLYATYYKTGTAYFESIIGLGTKTFTVGTTTKKEVVRKMSLGRGLSITPNIHTGREAGSKIFVQTSTGAIEVLQQANPGMTKSGRVSWQEQ